MYAFIVVLLSSLAYPIQLSPGSYTVKYGGLYKIGVSESNRFFENQWRNQQEEIYLSGEISFGSYSRYQQDMNDFLSDWQYGPPWWTRDWWESMPTYKGGAPPNHSIQVSYGSIFNIIDNPIFSLSNSFDVRWKHLEASIDLESNDLVTLGSATPNTGWKFKLHPDISISSRSFRENRNIIRSVGLVLSIVHFVNAVKISSIGVMATYRTERRAVDFEMQFKLLQW